VAAILASLACGVIFGFGLLISGLAQPHKVLAFLDVLGPWDPTLAIVMAPRWRSPAPVTRPRAGVRARC
jgi:uncharacterized membrane protein YedE/YeeE